MECYDAELGDKWKRAMSHDDAARILVRSMRVPKCRMVDIRTALMNLRQRFTIEEVASGKVDLPSEFTEELRPLLSVKDRDRVIKTQYRGFRELLDFVFR